MYVNGRVFIDTSTDPDTGISIGDIQKAVGRGTGDLGLLCSDQEWYDTGETDQQGNPVYALRRIDKIKTYAKYKPNGSTLKARLTLAQRQAANCGIDCTDSSTGCFSTSPASLMDRAKASCRWNKVIPTVFRILDFEEYNANASQPFQSMTNIVGNTTGDNTMYININLVPIVESYNMQVTDLVEALTRKGNTVSQFGFGLMYRLANSSGAPTIVPESQSGQYSFPAPASYGAPVTYDCVFVYYVQSGSSFWGCFLPNTYFQIRLAYFYVDVEDTTLSFPQAGGEQEIIIAGYNWASNWGGKGNPNADIVMSLTPDGGNETSTFSSVILNVSQSNTRNYTGSVTKKVIISAPGRVGTGADFTKEFTVTQACAIQTGYIALVDANNEDAGTEVILTRLSIDAERDIRIRADRSWKVADQNTSQGAGIVYRIQGDDSGTYYDGRNDINLSPSSATLSTHTTTTVTIGNLIQLPTNRLYEVLFVSLDGTASFRLHITPQAS